MHPVRYIELKIGDVTHTVKEEYEEWNVPLVFEKSNWYLRSIFETPEILSHLKWMIQKDQLRQDMMLLGFL